MYLEELLEVKLTCYSLNPLTKETLALHKKEVFEASTNRTRIKLRGEEQNREEGEMAPKKLGGGRNRGEK